MQKTLCYALAVALAALAYGADPSTPVKKPAAKQAPGKSAKAPAGVRKASKRAPVTTWRNRQMAPTPERYKEIQDALVARGYLRPEDTGNGWNQTSMDALKRFQGEQNIDASGKINSLSLIALGLGPKYESNPNPTKNADPGSGSDR